MLLPPAAQFAPAKPAPAKPAPAKPAPSPAPAKPAPAQSAHAKKGLLSSLKRGSLHVLRLGKNHSSSQSTGTDIAAESGADNDAAIGSEVLCEKGVGVGASSVPPSQSSSTTSNRTSTSSSSSSQAPVQFSQSVRACPQLSFIAKSFYFTVHDVSFVYFV
jgi:hypothetical protein